MLFLLIFLISFILTVFSTPYLIDVLKKNGIVDVPNKRKIHKGQIPRMGGLVIFSVFSIVLFSFYNNINDIRLVIIGYIFIILCGITDDMLGLKWYVKAVLQSVSALFLMAYLIPKFSTLSLFTVTLPLSIYLVILFLFILGTVNSINLMDGMDGLVSGFSILVMIFLASIATIVEDNFVFMSAIILSGSLLGFLKYNGYPAKIFLGDTGSLFLGFSLVFLSLELSIDKNTSNLDLTFPVLILAVPIVDTLKVIIYRLFKKKNPFLPDNNHLHHIILNGKVKHKITVFSIHTISLVFLTLALFYFRYKSEYVLIAFFVLSILMMFVKQIVFSIQFFRKINYDKLENLKIPLDLSHIYENSFFIVPTIILLLIIGFTFNMHNHFRTSDLQFLFGFGVLSFILASFHNKKSKSVQEIYFFFNFTIYFIINVAESSKIFLPFHINIFTDKVLFLILIFVLALFIIVFLLNKDIFLKKGQIFLNGLDLTIIILISFMFILNAAKQFPEIVFINESLFLAFIFYMWFKIFYILKPKAAKVIYYMSFIIPLSMLGLLITVK